MHNLTELTNFYSALFRETDILDWEGRANTTKDSQQLKTYPRLPRHHLPKPILPTHISLGDALLGRRSAQKFTQQKFNLYEISTLLAAVSLRNESLSLGEERRTYPSAGAKYPGEVYLIALHCEGIPPGLYHYALREHELEELWLQNLREPLARATNDSRLLSASLVLIFSLVHGRVAEKYGKRGLRYGLIEIGHMAQNISMAAHALEKGCYEIGGFIDSDVNEWLDVDGESETATLIMGLGGENK